jgi:hypothetical protein
MEIRAIEGTPNSVGDAPVLPRLHGQIDPHEALLSIIGDGAYGIEACNEVIALRQPRRDQDGVHEADERAVRGAGL